MFGRCGALARLVLPPTRTLAVVEYAAPADARRAFKALAYKRFQAVPLYLEWAPRGVFAPDAPLRAGQVGACACPHLGFRVLLLFHTKTQPRWSQETDRN